MAKIKTLWKWLDRAGEIYDKYYDELVVASSTENKEKEKEIDRVLDEFLSPLTMGLFCTIAAQNNMRNTKKEWFHPNCVMCMALLGGCIWASADSDEKGE
ncbi:MAG: hypothetical protein Q6363_005705 [Candidatus Njordarchaeota archaeon]